jgi:hypothetical protein
MNWCTPISPWASLHSTSLHLPFTSSPQFTSLPFLSFPIPSLHRTFYECPQHLHFALFLTFLTLFLKLFDLQESVPKTTAGSWFQNWMVLFTKEYFPISVYVNCRSQWPHGQRHELSSLTQTLWSWVRIPLKAWMTMCTFILCLCRQQPCNGLIPHSRSPTACVKNKKEIKKLKRPGPNKGL